MTRPSAEYWTQKLELRKHVEGGSFKELYRSGWVLTQDQLPSGFTGNRNGCTSIYFLLEQGQFSAFHRIKSDEVWHFYFGDPLIIYEIETNGELIKHTLGQDLQSGQQFQCVIKAGNWFASAPAQDSQYALAGCTVAPGFDFADFELADRTALIRKFPQHEALIGSLTYVMYGHPPDPEFLGNLPVAD